MKQLIFILFFSCSFILSEAQDLLEGIVGYYSFCGCNANDHSGNENHGALTGAPACIEGISGEGFQFNQNAGVNDCGQIGGEYVRLPTLGAIWENGISICAWVQYENIAYYERIVDFGNGDGDSGGMPIWFGREGNSDNLALESWISADANLNRTTGRLVAVNAITNGQIEFYCGTIEGDSMKIYVNGELVASKKGNPILNVERSNNFIGRSNWCSFDPDFKGFMDEVRVYNRALSAEEIRQLYNSPFLLASSDTTICQGESIQLNIQGGATYEWSPAASLNSSIVPNPIASPDTTTKYSCKIFFPDGCSITEEILVKVHTITQEEITAYICPGESFEGYSTSGTYVDTLTAQSGCDSIRTLQLTVDDILTYTETATICEGEAFEGYTETGVYVDTLIEQSGCLSLRTIDLTVLKDVKANVSATICEGENYEGYATTGIYTDNFTSQTGCDSVRILDLKVNNLRIDKLAITKAACGADNGGLDFEISAMTGRATITIDGFDSSTSLSYQNLSAGTYRINISDEAGCTIDTTASIPLAQCPIYIPNAFSPNGDGENDFFQLYSKEEDGTAVIVYQIFDRWGEQIYEAKNFPLTGSSEFWWDGKLRGKPIVLGVYVYFIEIEFENGNRKVFEGTVAAVK